MRFVLLLLGLMISMAYAAPNNATAQRDADAKALTALIQRNLPADWTVAYQPEYPGIRIKRLKPTAIRVWVWPSSPARMPNEKPQKPEPLRQYEYFLRIKKILTATDYQKMKVANTTMQKEMTRLATGLTWGKGYYMARNAEEKRRVEQYEKLEKSLYDLPDYYWRRVSLERIDIMGIPEYELVKDEKVRAECKRVTLKVLSLLHAYEKAAPVAAKAKQ